MEKLEKNQKSYTENGAVGYITTGSKLVDLNFAIPSFRDRIDEHLFRLALKEDEILTLKWLLYLRDIRQGVGERQSFREFVKLLVSINADLAKKFLQCVPLEEYGRWDDYIDILFSYSVNKNEEIKQCIAKRLFTQLTNDYANYKQGKTISLLAKWLPSENASSNKTKLSARALRKLFYMDSKSYRQILSELRKYLDIVERKMSSNNWDSIDYAKVPSKANLLYADAFTNHDYYRRNEYLDSLKKGETKINAQALFLHDIIHAYAYKKYDETLEQMWKAQSVRLKGFSNTLVVRDGSGSMGISIGHTSVTAQEVADAITLYCAENNTGEFKNKFITFSSIARLVDIGGAETVNLAGKRTLRDTLSYLKRFDDCSNTNIENVFDLILDTAIKNKLSQEELPKTVLIISDMEFDWVTYGDDNTVLFESISKKFRENRYALPKLVFWNVNSRTNTVPLMQNENGVILLSGFSKNLMSMVMSSELDPYKALVKELESGRYDVVNKIYDKLGA